MKKLILVLLISLGFNFCDAQIINSYSHTTYGVSYDADAESFMTATTIPDDTTVYYASTPQEITGHELWVAVNDLVLDFKSNGTWIKYYVLYIYIGGTASSHKWNLKDPRDLDAAYRATFAGTWVHSSTGALPDGSTAYADTHLVSATVLTVSDFNLGFYSRTNVAESGIDLGSGNGVSGSFLTLQTRTAADLFYCRSYWNSAGVASFANTDATGYYSNVRSTQTSNRIFKNGSFLFEQTTTALESRAANLVDPMGISAIKEGASWFFFSSKECAFAAIGDSLTDTEVANDYAAIQAFQTALGRQL